MTHFLLIGLGNPGSDYAKNRHNIGFMVVDHIVKDHGFSRPARKFGGSLSEGTIGAHKVHIFKSLGYMNTSGVAAAEAARFYKIPLEKTIVIHDDLDLPLGKLRVKRGGGNGGHNGLKSLDIHLGVDYLRVRLGIGHPGDKDMVSDYVLSDFTKNERATVELLVSEIAQQLRLLLDGDDARFMNKISLAMKDQ